METDAESWTVEAAVDLGAIGALHAKVTLSANASVCSCVRSRRR